MKVKVSESSGPVLDWLVAKCEDYLKHIRLDKFKQWEDLERTQVRDDDYTYWNPSEDWAQGGPIIEREGIDLIKQDGYWDADDNGQAQVSCMVSGPTALIAAMRCYTVSKLGEEVEVPERLLP